MNSVSFNFVWFSLKKADFQLMICWTIDLLLGCFFGFCEYTNLPVLQVSKTMVDGSVVDGLVGGLVD